MAHILVVDDDERICRVFTEFLTAEGHSAEVAGNAQDGLAIIEASHPDLVFLDVRMPGTDGLEALARIRELDHEVCVVMMTAFGTSQTSIDAMRLGAYDYLTKPLDLGELRKMIDSALESRELTRELAGADQEGVQADYSLVNLVGSSPRMQEAYKLIGLLAGNTVPALLLGERGTGKETVAKTIHYSSSRRDQPLAIVHSRGLIADRLEAEIFGRQVRDPQIGEASVWIGKLEAANGGTLFVDDIDALPMHLQAKLLRFLTDKTFERQGGIGAEKADTRLIAATDADLAEYVREGSFNEKLFQRLRTLSIHLPALRERLEDLPDLVAHLLVRCKSELGKTLRGVDDRVMESFRAYSWPGNVGELESVLKRAAVMARGEVITPADIGDTLDDTSLVRREDVESALELAVKRSLRHGLTSPSADQTSLFHSIVGEVERILVHEALAETSGNQVRAATMLGMNRTTLRKKIGS